MKNWDLSIPYNNKFLSMKAEIIYESNQIHRVKVTIKDHSITLQNDFPMISLAKSKRGIKWKIIDGKPKDPDVLFIIMQQLKKLLKKDAEDNQRNLFT